MSNFLNIFEYFPKIREKFDSAQANTDRSRIFREFLSENEFLSKTILACLLGAQMDSIHEINKMPKNLVTLPL